MSFLFGRGAPKPLATTPKEAVTPNKQSAGRFLDPSIGKVKNKLAQLEWRCAKCTVINKPTNKTCEVCSAKPPERAPLTISVTVPSHEVYASQPFLLADQKFTLTYAFLRDMLEAKSGIPEAKQLIFYKDALIEGEADDPLLMMLPQCDPADVIPLTLHHLDRMGKSASAIPASSASMPPSNPSFRKKASRSTGGGLSRQNSSPNTADDDFGDDVPMDDGAAWGDAADADDGAGDWGDATAAGDDGWGDGAAQSLDAFLDEEKESDTLQRARKQATEKLLSQNDDEDDDGDSLMATTPRAATASTAGSKAAANSSASAVTPNSAVMDTTSTYAGYTSKTSHYILRKPSQLEAHVQQLYEEAGELFGLTAEEAGILLRCAKESYNQPRIEEAWMNDSEKLRLESGLGPESDPNAAPVDPTTIVDCNTCGDEVPAKDSLALNCGEVFCRACWENWTVAEFDKGPTCIKTKCQGYKCPVVLPHAVQASFLPIAKREKLARWLLDDFVAQHQKEYRWCPHSDCQMNAQRLEGVHTVGGIDCTCAHSWCFDCGLEDHRPASCEDAKKWDAKNNSDAENVNWILANTKVCPKCGVNIEKNQGCNHMTCRKCMHEFCWLCKGNWKAHTSCSNYSGKGDPNAKEATTVEQAQNALKKYMHYWSRFDNHAKSIKFAEKTRKTAEVRMEEIQRAKGTGLLDVQFFIDSVNSVITNKRILQWLYVYAYYCELPEGSSDRQLFEMHQAKLEEFTDKLHGMTEAPVETLMKPETRVQMISFCATVAKFRKAVIESVEAANERNAAIAAEKGAAASPSPPPAAAAATNSKKSRK